MGSIDIPPFVREKMKQQVQKTPDSGVSIDIPDFIKKKENGITEPPPISGQPTLPSVPQSKSVESNPPVKPLLNTQQAAEKFGLTPIQNLQNQNVAKSDNTLSVPNAGVFNRQVNAFNEVTDKTITGNAPDESVVIRNEYQKKRKGILNPEVVIPASQLTPENNFGLNANINTPQVADNAVNKIQVKPVQGAPVNSVAPPTPEQEFKQKVSDNLSSLEKETIAKSGEYAMKVTSDPVAAGFITKAILGDNMAISQKRQIDKGYTVPQADLYQTGQVGITSMIAALDKKYESDPQNADYIAQKTDLENQAKNLIDKFPEYKVSQLTKAVAIELGKLHPEVSNSPSMARLYLPEIKKEMGLSDEDIKAIDFDNYPTSNFLTSTIAPIYKGALGLGLSATRVIGSALGADEDLLNSRLTEAAQSPTFFDDIETIQNTGQTIDTHKGSRTFLQNIADPNKGKYNYTFHNILNSVGSGAGSLAWFVYGTKGAGAAANKALGAVAGAAAGDGAISLNGLPVKLSADATNEVGMAGLMMGQGYEDYYQKARTVISDKPEDEWKRHTFSLISGALDYLGFRVLGNVVKGLPPAAEKEIGQVFKDAPNYAAVNKKALQSKLTNILQDVGGAAKETAFVGSATTASEIAKAVVVNVMGSDEAAKEENAQLPSVIEGSIASLPFSMFLPILGSKIIAGGQSKVHRENIYNAGISPENYKGDAHKLFDMGAINQEQLNDRIQVINTAANIVKSIPSDVFDNLNHNQRVTYVNSKIRESALKTKSDGIQDEALSAYYADQIKAEVAKRSDVLNGGGKEGEFPESVSVIKPKTQEEINNQIPTVTIEGKKNENITTQGDKQQQANSEQVTQSENLNFEPENKYQFYVTDVNQIPEQYRDRAVKTGETKSKKALFGIIPYGNESVTTHYRYELSGKEANDLVKSNNNAQTKTEVPKPTEAASTTNEAANKVEQATEESLVNQAKDLVNSGVVKGFTAETLKESANNNPTEFQQHLKDISEQANDPKSNKATVDTYGKELVDIAQKLNPVEAKSGVNGDVLTGEQVKNKLQEIEKQPVKISITQDIHGKMEQTSQEVIANIKAELDKTGLPYSNVISNDKGSTYFVVTKDGQQHEILKVLQSGGKLVPTNLTKAKWINHLIKTEKDNVVKAVEDLLQPKAEKADISSSTTPTEVNKPISVKVGNFLTPKGDINEYMLKAVIQDSPIIVSPTIENLGAAISHLKGVNEQIRDVNLKNTTDYFDHALSLLSKMKEFQDVNDSKFKAIKEQFENSKWAKGQSVKLLDELSKSIKGDVKITEAEHVLRNQIVDAQKAVKEKFVVNKEKPERLKEIEQQPAVTGEAKKENAKPISVNKTEPQRQGSEGNVSENTRPTKRGNAETSTTVLEGKEKPISVNEGEPFPNPLNENASKLLNQSLEKYSQSNKSTQSKLVEKVKENNREINDRISFLRENGVNEKGANFIDLQDQLSAGKEFLKRVSPKEKPISKPISEVKEKPSKPTNTKESNFSKKLKDKYKDFNLGGTKSAEKSDAKIEGEIKTDNGKQPIEQYVSRAKEVLNKLFPDATFESYKTKEEYEKAGGAEGTRGMFITESDGSKRLLLNVEQMKEDGIGKTAFHEAIHPIVDEVVGAHPEELNPLWNDLYKEMQGVKGFDKVVEHVDLYKQNERPAAEGLTELLTQIAEGNISLDDVPPARKGIIVDLLNKLFEKLGLNIRFGESYDFKDFATDIKKAFDTGDVEALKNVVDKRAEENKRATDNAGKVNDLLFGKSADKVGNSTADAKAEYEKELEKNLEDLRERRSSVIYSERKLNEQEKGSKTVSGYIRKLLHGVTPEDVESNKARLADQIKQYKKEKAELRAFLPKERGSNFVIEKLSRAARNGDIDQSNADLAIDLIRKRPDLFSDLAISITKKPNDDSGVEGWYRAADSLVKLFKNPTDDTTSVHEILHHTERFLPDDVRTKIIKEWNNEVNLQIADIQKKLKSETNVDTRQQLTQGLLYLGLAQERQVEPNYENAQAMERIMSKYLGDHTDSNGNFHKGLGNTWYKLYNPSEWWAVNASKMLQDASNIPELKTWQDKVKAFYVNLVQSVKKIFKNPYAAVEKGLKTVLDGKTIENREGQMLSQSKRLLNIKDETKGRFETAASKIADSIRSADIPQWIINTSSEAKQSGFGLSGENMKEALAKSIEAVGKIMDKGVDLKEAITREVDNFIKNIKSFDGIKDLKPTFEKTLRDNFEKEALNQFNKEQSDRAATVENMVKDAMDEGFDNLNDIKEAITNGLGIDTPAFRKMIDDAYEKVKNTPESEGIVNIPSRTGITHAATAELRDKYGLGNYVRDEAMTDVELQKKADDIIAEGYNPNDLVGQMENGIPPTPVENFILKRYVADLVAKFDKSKSDADFNDLNRVMKAVETIGTLQSSAFRTRGGLVDISETLPGFLREEIELNKNAPLTEGQKKKVEQEYNDIQTANADYEAKIAALEAENAALKEVKNRKANKKSSTRKTHEDYVKERQDAVAAAREALRKLRTGESGLSAVPLPGVRELVAIAPHVKKALASLVEEGSYKLADYVKELHGQFKDVLEGITEKDINNIIAGKYDEKKATRSELAARMVDLKTEANLVNRLEDLLKGEEPKDEKKKIKRNQAIESLRAKIKQAESFKRGYEKEVEQGQKEPVPDELKRLRAVKLGIERNLRKVQEDIDNGNFSPAQKATSILDNPEVRKQFPEEYKATIEAKDKLIKAKNERHLRLLRQQQENMSAREKAVKGVAEVLNIPRALMTMLDYSAMLRQAVIPTIAHPSLAGKSLVEMIKVGASQKRYDRWFYDLVETPRYKLMELSKLAITDSTSPLLTAREESFMSNLAEKIPVIGKTLNVGNVKIPGTNLVKGSERAYTMYLNKMRVDLFNRFADAMEERGLTFENSPKAYKEMANYVNNSTGRGDLGAKIDRVAPILNSLFFSPRLIASRMNMLTYFAQPRFYKEVPKEVRLSYLKDMTKFIGLGLTVLGLFSINKDDDTKVEIDPRSSDFGKIRNKNTRWDIWGGFQQYVRLFSQMATGERKSTTGKIYTLDGEGAFGQTTTDVLVSFGRGKLAPVPGMAVDLLSRRTIVGEKIKFKTGHEGYKEVNIGRYMQEHLLPLNFTGLQEALQDQGAKAWFTVGIPSTFGVGTQTFDNQKRPKKPKTKYSY